MLDEIELVAAAVHSSRTSGCGILDTLCRRRDWAAEGLQKLPASMRTRNNQGVGLEAATHSKSA